MPAKKTSALKKVAAAKPAARRGSLLGDVRNLIIEARSQIARTVDTGLLFSNWQIGMRIRQDVLKLKRAAYGEQIVSTLSRQLEPEFGRGYSEKSLRHMHRLAEVFPDPEIVSTLSRQLGWSHFLEIIYLKDDLQRDFYAEMCRINNWTVRMLRDRIDSLLYERTAISKKPEKLIRSELAALRKEDRITPDLIFRDPYVLDFLGLKGAYSEKDLESAIVADLQRFLTELGGDFAFIARQKRIVVDGEDFHIDLLFYHRGLRRLVAVELKLGRFMPADMGQMEFYLRWLKQNEMRPGEAEPLGIILCAEASGQRIEVLELEGRGIHIGKYLTALPPRKLLQQRLKQAVELARAKFPASSASKRKVLK
jgi:predicted nuclease of restriction endonuclease-like (RecB) superfamily